MSSIEIELIEETIKTFNSQSLPSDLVLKILDKVKQILNQYENREFNYKDVVKKQCEINSVLANIDCNEEKELLTNYITKRIKTLNDHCEYRITEVSNLLGKSNKYCLNLFNKHKVPCYKRDKHGNLYLGSDIKRFLVKN